MRYLIVMLVALVLSSTMALAASSDQLAATKHNFTTGTYNLGTGNICQPCHTPHHAVTDDKISTRLWNHKLSTATYTLYDGSTHAYDAAAGQIDGQQGMDRVSRLCLGCHDGTVALDSYGMGPDGSAAGHTGTINFEANSTKNLGTDFTNDHPVGVDAMVINAAGVVNGGYLKPVVQATSYRGPTAKIGNLSLQRMADGAFVVGCRTCHNPHGSGSVALTPYPKLLNVSEDTICTQCHYK